MQVSVVSMGNTPADTRLYALCDDGTLWLRAYNGLGFVWELLPNVLQEPIDEIAEHSDMDKEAESYL